MSDLIKRFRCAECWRTDVKFFIPQTFGNGRNRYPRHHKRFDGTQCRGHLKIAIPIEEGKGDQTKEGV